MAVGSNTEGMSGQERAYLPMLGKVDIYYLGNTPAITLPRYIQGVKTVTTKGGFAGLDEVTRSLRELGLLGTEVMQVRGKPPGTEGYQRRVVEPPA